MAHNQSDSETRVCHSEYLSNVPAVQYWVACAMFSDEPSSNKVGLRLESFRLLFLKRQFCRDCTGPSFKPVFSLILMSLKNSQQFSNTEIKHLSFRYWGVRQPLQHQKTVFLLKQEESQAWWHMSRIFYPGFQWWTTDKQREGKIPKITWNSAEMTKQHSGHCKLVPERLTILFLLNGCQKAWLSQNPPAAQKGNQAFVVGKFKV